MEKYIVQLFGVAAIGRVEVEAESLQEAVFKAKQYTQANPACLQPVQPFIFPMPAKLSDLEQMAPSGQQRPSVIMGEEERRPKIWTPKGIVT
jgi:hypothetical protein